METFTRAFAGSFGLVLGVGLAVVACLVAAALVALGFGWMVAREQDGAKQ